MSLCDFFGYSCRFGPVQFGFIHGLTDVYHLSICICLCLSVSSHRPQFLLFIRESLYWMELPIVPYLTHYRPLIAFLAFSRK